MAGLTLCLALNILHAEEGHYEGRVKDVEGNPLEFANVTLLVLKDSTLIEGTVTGSDGNFSLAASPLPSFMRIYAMGFEEKTINNPAADMGDIILTPAEYMLGEVVVKGSRPIARLKNDGVQVAISGTYLSDTGTALDVLGKMPFVTKSGSGLEVLGKGTPLVYINGRQVRDRSELDQLPSSQIKSVDVVTTPGARYASTVNAVIRITTVAPVGEGFSVNDRTTVGYKHYFYLFEQANFNYRKNGLDLFGMLNYENYRERPGFENTTTQHLKSGTVRQNSVGNEFARYPVYQVKAGMNYILDSHNFGGYYDFSFRPSFSTGFSLTSRHIDNQFKENLVNQSDADRHNRQHLLGAYYSGTVGKWQLAANFDAIWQLNDSRNDWNETSSSNPERRFTTSGDVRNRLLAGNLIASLPVWKGDLRFGAEISDIHRTDKYSGNADFIEDNDISIGETTIALFAETRQSFGHVTARIGLRWEFTDSRYRQCGILMDDRSRTYHNLAPSASISFPVGNVIASISFTRKTSRPAFEQLSSAIKYIDRYSYESGNPHLKPIYRDYLSASASWKDLVFELEYSSTKNYFMWQTTPYQSDNAGYTTLLKMENMPRFNSYGAYVNYAPTFFGCWHPSFMAGIMAQDFKITHNGQEMKLDKPIGIFRLNNAIRLPWEIWLNLDFSARSSGNGDNLWVRSYWQCDLGIYKSFANDTWNIKLQLNDLFDSWRQEFVSYDAVSSIAAKKLNDTRDLSLTVRYNFNSARSRYKGRGAANAEKSRF